MKIKDKKLSRDFYLVEFIEAQMSPQAMRVIRDNISQMDQKAFEEKAAPHAQFIRDLINSHFTSDTGAPEIGVTILSGWRPVLWEKIRNRSGLSQHVKVAYDGRPTNCSPKQAVEIIAWLGDLFSPRDAGHPGGFAICPPTHGPGGEIDKIGFFHFDFRDTVARWTY